MEAVRGGYSEQTDEVLSQLAAQGDRRAEEQLALRYSRLVRICARPFFLIGGDSEDLIQEGMVGLLMAIRTYEPQRGSSFRTYAEICIRNRIRSAVRAASRDKHSPLNTSVPLEDPLLPTAGAEGQTDPEQLYIRRENLQEWREQVYVCLSRLERQVLERYLEGFSYAEIATQLNRPAKSVDNAIQRIRRKLAQLPLFRAASES